MSKKNYRKIRSLFWITRNNIRTSLLSIVGLSIALILTTVVIIGARSSETMLLRETLMEKDFYIEAEVQLDLTKELVLNRLLSWNTSFINMLYENHLGEFLDKHTPVTSKWKYKFPGENETSFIMHATPDRILEEALKYSTTGSKLPANFNESLILIPTTSKFNNSLDKTYQISINTTAIISGFPVNFWINHSFKIVGIVAIDELPLKLLEEIYPDYPYSKNNQISLITDLLNFWSFANHSFSKLEPAVRSAISHSSIPFPFLEINYEYFFNFSHFTKDQSEVVITGIKRISQNLTNFNRIKDDLIMHVGFQHNLSSFTNLVNIVDQLSALYFCLAIPMLVISFLVVNFSFSITNHKKSQIIEILKNRGLSNKLILLALIIETFILYIIAFIIAMFLGFPLTIIMSKSRFLLDFTDNIISTRITLNDIQTIFFTNMIFIIIIYLKPLISISRLKITELERIKKGKPFWQKHHIDIFFLLVGLFLSFFTQPFLMIYLDEPAIYVSILPIILSLIIISPFFLLLGMIFLFARAFEYIIQKSANFFWEKRGGFLSLSLKNLHLNNQLSSRAGLVISLATCFLVVFSIISFSLATYEANRISYENGSDIVVILNRDIEIVQILEEIKRIEGINEIATALSYTYFYEDPNASDYSETIEVELIGIQNNSATVLMFKDYYSEIDLRAQISLLSNSKVIINNEFRDRISTWTEVANEFNLYFYNSTIGNLDKVPFQIIGTFRYFPHFYNGREDCIIGDFEFISSLAARLTGELSPAQYHFFVKCNPQAKPKLIFNQLSMIENLYGAQIFSESILQENSKDSGYTQVFWLEINSNISVALITIVTTVLLYTSTRIIVHSQEDGLNRALGLKPIQNFKLRNLEILIILFSGVFIGFIIGLLISQSLLLATNFLFIAPPIFQVIPWGHLMFLLLVITIISILFTFLIITVLWRIDISKQLRVI